MVELACEGEREEGFMSSYAKVRKELVEQRQDDGARCRQCHGPAEWATLSSYGGLCGSCYGSYCREPLKAGAVWNGPRGNAGDAVKL